MPVGSLLNVLVKFLNLDHCPVTLVLSCRLNNYTCLFVWFVRQFLDSIIFILILFHPAISIILWKSILHGRIECKVSLCTTWWIECLLLIVVMTAMEKNQSLTLSMILCYAWRWERSISVSERLHPAISENRCRDLQPNILWRSEVLWKSWGEHCGNWIECRLHKKTNRVK
jgi:hypothetical protein